MLNFKVLEYMAIGTLSKEPINKECINLYHNWKYTRTETRNELDKEIRENKLQLLDNLKFLLRYNVDYNVEKYYFASATDNKENYYEFLNSGGLQMLPKNYYYHSSFMNFEGFGIKVKQKHNIEIEGEYDSEYMFLDISFDSKALKLKSFENSKLSS